MFSANIRPVATSCRFHKLTPPLSNLSSLLSCSYVSMARRLKEKMLELGLTGPADYLHLLKDKVGTGGSTSINLSLMKLVKLDLTVNVSYSLDCSNLRFNA